MNNVLHKRADTTSELTPSLPKRNPPDFFYNTSTTRRVITIKRN